jgi:hypothetical protein
MRRWIVPLLKLGVAAALVAYVVASGLLDFSRLKALFRNPFFPTLALMTLTAQLLVSAWRTRRLLRAHGEPPDFWLIIRLTYLGAFFDAVSIASVGGDAMKAWYLAQATPPGRRTEAVSALVVDRLLGLLGLLTLTVAAMLWHIDALWSDRVFRPYVIGLFAVCAGLAVGTFMLFSKRVHEWTPLRWLLGKLPFGGTVNRAYASMQAFRGRPVILLEGWLLSLCVHVLSSTSGYLLALGLGMSERGARLPGMFEPGLFFAALLIGNFVCSFASFGAVGVGQATFAFAFERVARMSGGADLATAAQVAFFLAKTPGLVAWLAMRKKT